MVNNLIKAIGWSIVHSLWQGAVVYAILFIVLMAWPKLSARLKHNLAFGSLFLIFTSFCFTFFSVFELPTSGTAVKQIAINHIAYQDLTTLSSSLHLKAETYFPVVASIYTVGIIFQLIVLLSGYAKLKRLKRESDLAVPEVWASIFESILTQLKINKTVRFYLSSKVNVPLVVGFFKPVVLFPVALATQLDLQQVEAILIHELSHIRRNDYLINLVKTCIETLLFFNPFVWLTTRFIQIEREHACDDLVVNLTGTPVTYAHALLKLELIKDKQQPSLSLAATGKNQHLYQRIKRITDMKTNYMSAKQQFFILTLTITTVVSLAWINPKKQENNKKPAAVTLIKTAILPADAVHKQLILRADTDTTKKKSTFNLVLTDSKGKRQTYTSLDEVPDSLKHMVLRNQFIGDSIAAFYNSPAWKSKMEALEKSSAEMAKKFESKEWKDQMAKVQEQSLAMAKKFESKEWKDQMAKIQEESLAISKKFESKEWKDQMAKVQEQSLAMAKKFESKEWKDQMAKITENSIEIAKKFDSPEWKKQMEQIQKNAEEMTKKFNSPEWKQKIEDYKKLQDSPEYKELQEKFQKDLEELKKKKGIKSDKAFLLFDTSKEVLKAFLPSTGPGQVYAAAPVVVTPPPYVSSLSVLNIPPLKVESFKTIDPSKN